MKLTRILIISFILIIPQILSAQNFRQRFEGIPVSIGGSPSANPFNGGIDVPRFQMIDIDADGDLDLFLFDRDTSLNFYRNDGNASLPYYNLMSQKYFDLPVKNWFFFVDIDFDGDYDLFTGGDIQKIKFIRNTGSPSSPNFILVTSELRSNTNEVISAEPVCNHVLADIDNDNDFDLFLGNSVGTITFYRNIGTPQNYSFQFVTDIFAGIEIIGGGSNMKAKGRFDNERHGASSIYFTDYDADADLDLFWGDFFGFSIYLIKNTGTPQNFTWNAIDTNNPKPNPWFSSGYNMPRIYDINNDGRKDFFVGVIIGNQTKNNFVHYRNEGPVNNPQFMKITENYILSIEVGSNSFPVFADIDNDGDQDLFIGSGDSLVAFYRNTGSPAAPSFTLVNSSIINSAGFNLAPSAGDLDGDGKKDIVLGAFVSGRLKFYRHTGTLSAPSFTFTPSQLDTFQFGISQSSTPSLVDIDNDGDLDLFAGHYDGRISYYMNAGSPSSFNFAYVTNFYNNIDVGFESNLSFGDIDNDGDYDMFIGRQDGRVSFYRNDGSAGSPNFVPVTNNFANIGAGSNSVPSVVDINTDTDKDIFVGNIKGGLYYFENLDVFGIKQVGNEVPESYRLYQNYPNPFNAITNYELRITNYGFVTLKVLDILGREVSILLQENMRPGVYIIRFDGTDFPSGVYFYELRAGDFRQTRKMVLLK